VRYTTLAEPLTFADEPVKGSRFVARASPAQGEGDALAAVEAARAAWPDATHHTWAYRLRDGRHRHSDAGEPGGSAGRPILAQIEGHGLSDVVVVVARWFGGTKLGVGGLVRAYGACAGRALDRAVRVEVVPTVELVVRHGYDDVGAVQAAFGAFGVEVVDTRWDTDVAAVVRVGEDRRDGLIEALRDRTSGRVRIGGNDA
jgi:uncharacterized YigZ family protein